MLENIHHIYWSVNLFMNTVFIFYCHSQIFEFHPMLDGYISYIYIMIFVL
jgi:hypothetical protein